MAKGESPIQKKAKSKATVKADGSKAGQDGEMFTHGKAKSASGASMKAVGRNLARAKNQGDK